MIYALIALLATAVILFILSYFMHDKIAGLEEQFEQFSMASLQDTYQIKKKLKVLEEELLIEGSIDMEPSYQTEPLKTKQPPMIQKVYQLHLQGHSVANIAKQTNLATNDIKAIIQNSK